MDIESHTARTNYKEAFENLDRARKAFIDSQQLELEFNNKKERLIETKCQLVADLKETEKLMAESLEDLSNRETNDVLKAESDSLRQQLFDSREKLVEAKGRLQNIVTQTTDRQTRLSAIKEELEAWMDRISQAEARMSELNIRQDAEINELERLKNKRLLSTVHRVVNPSIDNLGTSRYSIPFFMHPKPEMDLTCLESCHSQNNPKQFVDITAGRFLEKRLRDIGLKS